MKVRKATIEDVELIVPVFMDCEKENESYLSTKYKSMRNKKKPLLKYVKIALKADIEKKGSRFLLMEDNGAVVGYIFGEVRDDRHPLFERPKTAELSDIAVLGKYRKQGVAARLYKELESWFVKKGCRMITLSVNFNNTAQEMYKKWGFEKFYLRMIKKL